MSDSAIPVAMSEELTITHTAVHDRREVHLHLGSDAPLVYTPAERTPIRPQAVRFTFRIPDDGAVYSVELTGDLVDERDRKRVVSRTFNRATGEYHIYVPSRTRRLSGNDLPPWLVELTDRYRPRHVEPEQPS